MLTVVRDKKCVDREMVHEIRPFYFRLHIIVSTNILMSFKRRKLPGTSQPGDTAYAFVWLRKGCGDLYAFFPPKTGLGATAHEMFHVVKHVMEAADVPLTESTEEVYAYHLEELTQVAAEFIHADGKQNTKKGGKKK